MPNPQGVGFHTLLNRCSSRGGKDVQLYDLSQLSDKSMDLTQYNKGKKSRY